MKMRKKLFILVVLLQVLFLVGMIVNNLSIIWWGKEIILLSQPVDPHSLFSGDYVNLGYEISSLNLQEMGYPALPQDSFNRGDRIYVKLEKQGPEWQAAALSRDAREFSNSLFIQGEITYFDYISQNLTIRYGIENYYAPSDKARHYQSTLSDSMPIKVMVDRFGRAKVIGPQESIKQIENNTKGDRG